MDISINTAYGIHTYTIDGTLITGISAPTWNTFLTLLLQLDHMHNHIVLSPELITIAGKDNVDLAKRATIRMQTLKLISTGYPHTLFLVGTPTFCNGGKPKNSVVFLKKGRVLGQTHKRSWATDWERKFFAFDAMEPATLIPGTNIGLLICAEVIMAPSANYSNAAVMYQLCEKHNLVGYKPTFVHTQARALAVISCWGCGGNEKAIQKVGAAKYYELQLRNAANHIGRAYPQIAEIVMVDRAIGKQLPLNAHVMY